MSKSITLIGLLLLFVFGFISNSEKWLQFSADEMHTCIESESMAVVPMECASFVSASAGMPRTNGSIYEFDSQAAHNFQSILQSRNDHERVHLHKLFKITLAYHRADKQSEFSAQTRSKLPELEHQFAKFACNYYLYTLRRILI